MFYDGSFTAAPTTPAACPPNGTAGCTTPLTTCLKASCRRRASGKRNRRLTSLVQPWLIGRKARWNRVANARPQPATMRLGATTRHEGQTGGRSEEHTSELQ